jgi:5-methylcytosine-specific restriction enzyme A
MPANGRWPYCDPRWTTIRLLVLARDSYRCQASSLKHSRIKDVDHIIEWTKRPDLAFEPTNLRTLCRLHHNRKTHGKRRRNSRRW